MGRDPSGTKTAASERTAIAPVERSDSSMVASFSSSVYVCAALHQSVQRFRLATHDSLHLQQNAPFFLQEPLPAIGDLATETAIADVGQRSPSDTYAPFPSACRNAAANIMSVSGFFYLWSNTQPSQWPCRPRIWATTGEDLFLASGGAAATACLFSCLLFVCRFFSADQLGHEAGVGSCRLLAVHVRVDVLHEAHLGRTEVAAEETRPGFLRKSEGDTRGDHQHPTIVRCFSSSTSRRDQSFFKMMSHRSTPTGW